MSPRRLIGARGTHARARRTSKRDDAAAAAEAARLEAERAPRRAARSRSSASARRRASRRARPRRRRDDAVRDLQRDVDALESAERPIAEYVASGKTGELEKTAAEMRAPRRENLYVRGDAGDARGGARQAAELVQFP